MLQKKTIFVLVALALSLVVFVTGCLFWLIQLGQPVHGQGVSFSAPVSEREEAVSVFSSQWETSSAVSEAEQVEPVSQEESRVSQVDQPEVTVVATPETPVVVQEENTVTQTFTEEQLNHETSADNTGTAIQPSRRLPPLRLPLPPPLLPGLPPLLRR